MIELVDMGRLLFFLPKYILLDIVLQTKKLRATGQQPGTKSGHFLRDIALFTNWLSLSIQKPRHIWTARGGAAHGGAAGRGGDGQDGTPTDQSAQDATVPPTPQTIGEKPLGRVSGSTNRRTAV